MSLKDQIDQYLALQDTIVPEARKVASEYFDLIGDDEFNRIGPDAWDFHGIDGGEIHFHYYETWARGGHQTHNLYMPISFLQDPAEMDKLREKVARQKAEEAAQKAAEEARRTAEELRLRDELIEKHGLPSPQPRG